jgi:hypothetical protein
MKANLTSSEMKDLIAKVFAPTAEDKTLLILVDVPNQRVADFEGWRDRRVLAREWQEILTAIKNDLGLKNVHLLYYENSGSNNADLPHDGFKWEGDPRRASAELLNSQAAAAPLLESLAHADIILAPTQFSATAPLKVLARQQRFRAATMPGFSRDMIPALGVDYNAVHQRVMAIKIRLDEAVGARILFNVSKKTHRLFLDLRHRTAHASSGLLRERGAAGNLPSGEAYIVPYEGEASEASRTAGMLPVQFGDEMVLYEIRENRARRVLSQGPQSQSEARKLEEEPAYGNLAELGFGVLAAFGVQPVGETLLDEKLGLHIAFGRSDHFGGAVSPADFRYPNNVVHIDRIYIPEVQNQVRVKEVVLEYPGGREEIIIAEGKYTI